MHDMHKKLNAFYENHVRLKEERKKLAGYRDTNLDRLRDGLDKLKLPRFYNHVDQGSFAMFTINQHPKKDYDLDEGIIFKKDDLPASALDARNRVEKAMQEGGGNFAKPPEALTNAVRISYAEGHHIDLAIYRTYTDSLGVEIIEHAGCEWTPRDPMDITNWFNDAVVSRSPSGSFVYVEKNQLRRVTRWMKGFSKSRETWDLPGGLILSVLSEECYHPDYARDDVSLYNTMNAILGRIRISQDVCNPVNKSQSLTERPVDKGRVCRLRDKLETAIEKLSVLNDLKCTEEEAMDAWYWVFQHPFWSTDEIKENMNDLGSRLGKAAADGSLFVTPTGRVFTQPTSTPAIKPPPQRFFGEE
jgi:hypothetical protein